jgi:hypothetical protein
MTRQEAIDKAVRRVATTNEWRAYLKLCGGWIGPDVIFQVEKEFFRILRPQIAPHEC